MPDDTFEVITCSLNQTNTCYYRCSYPKGYAYVLLYDIYDKVFEPVHGFTFISTTTKVITNHAVNPKILAEGFLIQNGTNYKWENDTIVAEFEKKVVIEFYKKEDNYLITNMERKIE